MQPPRPTGETEEQKRLLKRYAAQVQDHASQRDEMLAGDGTVKPVWQTLFDHLTGLTPDQLAMRFARGDQYLRDAGVLYRQYDESLSTEREWPLSHIPVLLGEAEWDTISAGLIERANLLEYVLRDFYGDNTLVSSGQLPATLLSRNPAWLRPMVGVGNGGKPLLNSLSFEIGRGPDGAWWVISDLVEAPSTAGFAIENRIAMSRVFPNFFKRANVLRLAGFFKTFQQTLFDLKGQAAGEIALLSPGPMNQSYAEHAYLARYLGLLLVEGEDLIVEDGQAMVRTVAGPKPVSLLWSRLPSLMFDPLELNPESMLGAPGLLQAVRTGTLKTVNAVGAGVLETRALMAFLPSIARNWLGRDLLMPNIATWWCGQEAQRNYVLEHRQSMMVGDAFSTRPLMADPMTVAIGGSGVEPHVSEHLAETLRMSGHSLVGQEAVTLSTTPAFGNKTLVPRPMCIRISLGRTEQGWTLMPGGYARVSAGRDPKALAMQQGGRVADVWILSARPVETTSLLQQVKIDPKHAHPQAMLPSRAADNLFWLGRYVERSEHNMRLFRAYFARISDGAFHDDPIPRFMRAALMDDVAADAQSIAKRFSEPLKLSLQAASRISDRFSPDGMMALRGLVTDCLVLEHRRVALDDMPAEISRVLRQITGFAGLMHENMVRSDGWRFLSIGVSLERAANLCQVLACCVAKDAPDGALDLALDIADSVVAHRARFLIWANDNSVADLLGLDPQNPRSIRYHVSRIKEHLSHLPRRDEGHVLSKVSRRVLLVETQLATVETMDMTPTFFAVMQQDLWDISDALHTSHLV